MSTASSRWHSFTKNVQGAHLQCSWSERKSLSGSFDRSNVLQDSPGVRGARYGRLRHKECSDALEQEF
jgi:hypothetical protein